jgi:hypothetical protein
LRPKWTQRCQTSLLISVAFKSKLTFALLKRSTGNMVRIYKRVPDSWSVGYLNTPYTDRSFTCCSKRYTHSQGSLDWTFRLFRQHHRTVDGGLMEVDGLL